MDKLINEVEAEKEHMSKTPQRDIFQNILKKTLPIFFGFITTYSFLF